MRQCSTKRNYSNVSLPSLPFSFPSSQLLWLFREQSSGTASAPMDTRCLLHRSLEKESGQPTHCVLVYVPCHHVFWVALGYQSPLPEDFTVPRHFTRVVMVIPQHPALFSHLCH